MYMRYSYIYIYIYIIYRSKCETCNLQKEGETLGVCPEKQMITLNTDMFFHKGLGWVGTRVQVMYERMVTEVAMLGKESWL